MSNKPHQEFISNPFRSSFKGLDRLFKLNTTPAIIILVVGLLLGFQNYTPSNSGSGSADISVSAKQAIAIAITVLIFSVIFSVVGVIYTGVVNFVAYKTMKNESTTITEALRATMKKFWAILGTMILSGLKIVGGLLLFIVPGIRAMLRYQMVLFPIFDEDASPSQATRRVKKLTKGHLMEVFGIASVGSLLFPINTLIQMGGHLVLYSQLKDLETGKLEKVPTHWLNYFGLIIAGFLLLVGLLIAGLVVAI